MSGGHAAVVSAFMSNWHHGLAAMKKSFEDHLAEYVVYENIGLTRTTSREDAIALIENFLPGLDHIKVDTLATAVVGNMVFNERIDHLCAANGTTLASIRVAGVFEIVGDQITAWRDYFDATSFAHIAD